MRTQPPTPTLDFARWILWRDEHLIAVNKPAGVLSQGADGGAGANLVDLARAFVGGNTVAVAHRIDRNVSGIVLLALTVEAARGLSSALATASVRRVYSAVVRGSPEADAFSIDAPLLKNERTNEVVISPRGKPSRTEVRVEARFGTPLGAVAVLAVSPITGRSHQIRAHLAHVRLPIIGDPKYGIAAAGVRRPFLHAKFVEFAHPVSGRSIEVTCEPPWSETELRTLRRPQGKSR